MSDAATTRIRLPFLAAGQAQKHVTVNEAWLRLDALTQCAVASRVIQAQPPSPTDGEMYILPIGAIGDAWSTFTTGDIAYYRDGAWEAVAPSAGWSALVLDSGQRVQFDGERWGEVAPGSDDILINGRFDIWQRGASVACDATHIYCADRWAARRHGFASGLTVTREEGPSGTLYALRARRTAGNASVAPIEVSQTLETLDSVGLAGRVITLRWRARIGSAYSASALRVSFFTGTGVDQAQYAGLTGGVEPASADVSPGASFAAGALTALIPADAKQVAIVFTYTPTGTAGAADWFEIADVGLSCGAGAPLPTRRRVADEVALCQRYFQKSYNLDVAPGAVTSTGVHGMTAHAATSYLGLGRVTFPVTMRNTPTITLYNPSSGATSNPMRNGNAGTDLPGAVSASGASGFLAIVDLSLVGAAETTSTHYTASAEL